MQGVIVELQYGDDFDRARIEGVAREVRGRFEGMPGLRQKAFTVDEGSRRATNIYLWDSAEAAHEFFSDELREGVMQLYGVRPTVSFVEVAQLVDNS